MLVWSSALKEMAPWFSEYEWVTVRLKSEHRVNHDSNAAYLAYEAQKCDFSKYLDTVSPAGATN